MSSQKNSVIFTLLDAPAWGGAEEYVYQNVLALTEDHDVVVATNNAQVKEKMNHKKIKVIHLPYVLDAIGNWKGLIKYFLSLPHSIFWITWKIGTLKKKYKHVFCLFPGYSDRLTFSPIVTLHGCKLFWWEFGPLEPTFKQNWGFPKLLFRMSQKLPDKIITISKNTQHSLETTGKILPQNIALIYPGTKEISEEQFKRLKKSGEVWKKEHDISEKHIITCLGRITKEKEFELVIQAISKLGKNVQEKVHLIIIGSGPNLEQLEQLTKQLEIEKNVMFTGFVSDIEKEQILAISDIFIFPSAWALEGFGMTTIEAMMLRNAILTTGHGPQAEIVDNEKDGLYVEPRNERDIAKKIERVVEDHQLLKRLQHSAYEKAIEKFSLSRMQRQIKSLSPLGREHLVSQVRETR